MGRWVCFVFLCAGWIGGHGVDGRGWDGVRRWEERGWEDRWL